MQRLAASAILSIVFVFTVCSSSVTQSRLPKSSEIREAVDRGDLATAERLLRDYERADNGGFTRNNYDYLLARVLDQQGKAADAGRTFLKVVTRNSALSGYAMWHLAELARAAGDYKEEQTQLQKLLLLHGGMLNRQRVIQRLGSSHLQSRQYPQAITTLMQISGTSGAIARDAMSKIGEAQAASNQSATARATFDALLNGGYQDDAALKAVLILDRLDEAERKPLVEAERLRRARICQFNRDFTNARKHWLAIINEFPSSPARSESLFQLGRTYELEDKFSEALPWYQKAWDEFPRTEDGEKGFYYVGHCHQYLKNADKAVARYEEYLKMFPRGKFIVYAHLNAIDTLRSARRDTEALQWTARTQALPDAFAKTTGLFHQARLRVSQENWAAALADFTQLLSRNLNVRGLVATTNLAEVTFMRAYCLEKLGRFDEAISIYLSLPEGRNSANGYYGWRATQRLNELNKNLRAKNVLATRLQQFLAQARSGNSQMMATTTSSADSAAPLNTASMAGSKKSNVVSPAKPALNTNALTAKVAALQSLRLTDDEKIRREMNEILRAAYAKLPGYAPPRFKLILSGRMTPLGANDPQAVSTGSSNHQALADELLFLGLYDEGATELAAALSGSAMSRDLEYSLAWYLARGARGDRAISLMEPQFKTVPEDYRIELMPRETVEMLYPMPYRELMQKHAVPRNVDPRFMLSIARQESRFNPTVKSGAAARGLLQFISSTSSQIAAQLRLADFEQEDLYTPNIAILIGSQYMKNLFDEFGSAQAAAAAYNGSEQHVRRCLDRAHSNEVDRFVIEIGKHETKDYVYKVLTNLQAYQALSR